MKKIIKTFFYKKGDFQPPYFWITIMMVLVINTFVLSLIGVVNISDARMLGILGFVAAWLAVYNWDRKNGTSKKN